MAACVYLIDFQVHGSDQLAVEHHGECRRFVPRLRHVQSDKRFGVLPGERQRNVRQKPGELLVVSIGKRIGDVARLKRPQNEPPGAKFDVAKSWRPVRRSARLQKLEAGMALRDRRPRRPRRSTHRASVLDCQPHGNGGADQKPGAGPARPLQSMSCSTRRGRWLPSAATTIGGTDRRRSRSRPPGGGRCAGPHHAACSATFAGSRGAQADAKAR